MIQAICWVLIHSLWQGLLFTVATGLVMMRTKKMTAALRYNWLSGLFFLFLATCACTFFREWRLSQITDGRGPDQAAAVSGTVLGTYIRAMNTFFSAHASLIVLGWFLVFLAKCVRMTGSLVYTQRIRHYGTSGAPAGWSEKVQTYCRQLQITKKVQLLESRIVKMPLVAGHWKPIILVPLGLLTQLPPGEIEAMLLHELAHIRRHDYLVNFLQHIAENIFFFNPGLLWISALLRQEREYCCDDMAIARTNNRIAFIQALINFKEYDLRAAGLANAFPAGKNQLVQRVMRIAHNRNKTLTSGEKIFFLGSSIVVAFLLAAGVRESKMPMGSHQQVLVRKAPTATPPATAAVSVTSVASAAPVVRHRDRVRSQGRLIADSKETARTENRPAWNDEVQTERDRVAAARDREQSVVDSRQAERDRQQAAKDAEQAAKDRQQADRDREQAEQDRLQADRDKIQAEKDRMQADRDRAVADKQRAEMIAQKGKDKVPK